MSRTARLLSGDMVELSVGEISVGRISLAPSTNSSRACPTCDYILQVGLARLAQYILRTRGRWVIRRGGLPGRNRQKHRFRPLTRPMTGSGAGAATAPPPRPPCCPLPALARPNDTSPCPPSPRPDPHGASLHASRA